MTHIPWIIILFIGGIYAFVGFYTPFLGDDLGFYNSFMAQNDCWYALPRSMYRHWIWNNSRFADMLNPIPFGYMPGWLQSISNGIVTSLFFYLISTLCVGKIKLKPHLSIVIIFLITFTLRWDAIWMEFCTSYNYIWGAAFILAALLLIFSKTAKSNIWYSWLCIPLCFIGGAMHEAAGIPASIAFLIFLLLNRSFLKNLSISGKFMAFALIAGGFFTVSSPANYSRVGTMLQPESPFLIILGSASYIIILSGCIIYLLFAKIRLLKYLIHSSWIVFAIASYISAIFMLISQFGGRTGWYCQIFALIAIFKIFQLSDFKFEINKNFANIFSIILSLLIISHYCALALWQKKLGSEASQAIEMYKDSPDGIIYLDYLNEPQIPWFLFRKTHGVPDEDDSYYLYRISKHYGHGKPIVILPAAARHFDWDNLKNPLRIESRIISPFRLGNSHVDKIVDLFPRNMIYLENIEYIENRFEINHKTFYLYSPVDRDPGEK